MDTIHNLYTALIANVLEIDNLTKNIENPDIPIEQKEILYANEFKLYMDNIGIYEDLVNELKKVEKTVDNELELARIRKGIEKLLKVEILEI